MRFQFSLEVFYGQFKVMKRNRERVPSTEIIKFPFNSDQMDCSPRKEMVGCEGVDKFQVIGAVIFQ